MDNTVGSLTNLQQSVIIGSLLGDGYTRIISGKRNALLEINHSYAQREYVDWKYQVLKSIVRSAPKQRTTNGARVAYRFYTRQHPNITKLHRLFYRNGHKTIPDMTIDPIILAVWYMDDGSWCRSTDVYFNTQQFSAEDQQHAITLLKQFNIESRVNTDKQYLRIRVLKSSIPTLRAIIAPHLVPSMSYKLGNDPVETQP